MEVDWSLLTATEVYILTLVGRLLVSLAPVEEEECSVTVFRLQRRLGFTGGWGAGSGGRLRDRDLCRPLAVVSDAITRPPRAEAHRHTLRDADRAVHGLLTQGR